MRQHWHFNRSPILENFEDFLKNSLDYVSRRTFIFGNKKVQLLENVVYEIVLFQDGESDHVLCCKNVLCYMQDKTSPIEVNGRQQKILTFLTKFISFS